MDYNLAKYTHHNRDDNVQDDVFNLKLGNGFQGLTRSHGCYKERKDAHSI
jgi:hypothetical protein